MVRCSIIDSISYYNPELSQFYIFQMVKIIIEISLNVKEENDYLQTPPPINLFFSPDSLYLRPKLYARVNDVSLRVFGIFNLRFLNFGALKMCRYFLRDR